MHPIFKHIVANAFISLACVPVSLIVTVSAVPFWRWIEERFDIESIGHSGPAEWCFLLVYGLFAALFLFFYWQAQDINNKGEQ